MIRLFRVFVPTSLLVMLVSEAILVTTCFLAALFLTQPEEFEIILYYEGGILHISLMVAAFMLTMYFSDMYEETRTTSKIYLMQQLLMTVGVLFMSQALLAYGNRDLAMSRPVTLVGSVLLMIIIPAWRIAYSRYAFEVFGSEKILFLGSNAVVSAVAEHVTRHPELGYKGIGIIDDRLPIGDTLAGLPVIGIPADVERIAKENRPDCIVVGLTERRATLPVYALLELRFLGIIIEEAANTYERLFRRVPINGIRPSQLIFTSELGPQQSKMRLQMIYSWIIALAGCLVAAPIMIVVAILVRITSRGPVLFRQVRVGLNSEPFTVYKFRSMVVDAEAKTGAVWASRHDPRVTPIGRQLRRLRLDELPQLINVLRGEMAIVGPRPERPEFVTQLTGIIPFYRQRHAVRPGITGWAQINYKYGDTIEDTIMKLEYDLYYIKNLSPSLDFYIILHTLKVMLSSRSGQ